jgi:hypothetical protein
MACTISCVISAIFLIGMFYFYNITGKSEIIGQYKSSLSLELQKRYDKITNERLQISYQGYALGVVLSLCIIFYNLQIKGSKMNNISLVCTVIATAFVTNYLYYMIHPKSDWMLNHLQNKEEIRAWLQMYKEMQFNYHIGITFGIIAVGFLAFAFRC